MESRNPIPEINIVSTESKFPIRKKVLGIGFWNAYCRSPEYLALKPKEDSISYEELEKHCNEDSMWMALRHDSKLNVYDVTKFSKYHPGGVELIAEHAGTDASEAFRCAHAYVSTNMISQLKLGVLQESGRPKRSPNTLSTSMNPMLSPAPLVPLKPLRKKPVWDWINLPSNTDQLLTVSISKRELISLLPRSHCLAMLEKNLTENNFENNVLTLRILLSSGYYTLRLRLLPSLKVDLASLSLCSESMDKVSINIECVNQRLPSKPFSTLGQVLQDEIIDFGKEYLSFEGTFLCCTIIESKKISNYRYLCLQWPATSSNISIPLMHHVYLKVVDALDISHIRPYTPICSSFGIDNEYKNNVIELLVKVYSDGLVSTLLDTQNIGDTISVSLPIGGLKPCILLNTIKEPKPWNSVFLFAGGSGITPFFRIIKTLLATHTNTETSSHKPWLRLFWFNQSAADIVFQNELQELNDLTDSRFSVSFFVSNEDKIKSNPIPLMNGRLTDMTFKQFIAIDCKPTSVDDTIWLICGPPGFNEASARLASDLQIPSKSVHIIQN